jgi:hypothetical protein
MSLVLEEFKKAGGEKRDCIKSGSGGNQNQSNNKTVLTILPLAYSPNNFLSLDKT